MTRTRGSKNIVRFEDRKALATTAKASILHIASEDLVPLKQFKDIILNQNNYLGWLTNMRDRLAEYKDQENQRNGLTGRNALSLKSTPYNKYNWYIRQIFLLELINGYEVFYKTSIVRLAETIKLYLNPESLKGEVDAKVLWHANSSTSLIALVFEKKLFHDVSAVDDATNSLIGRRRYNPNNRTTAIYSNVVKKLEAIFQIRHTLSHNSGLVTESDAAKLRIIGYRINTNEAIDSIVDGLGLSIARFLKSEAEAFTEWLKNETKSYLVANAYKVTTTERDALKKYFGGDDIFWSTVTTS
jgi:hypothetical protein